MTATKASHEVFNGGCSKSMYELIPSLFRNGDRLKNHVEVEYLENNLYYDFCAYGDGIIQNKGEWDVLFNMQHHGIPTRLLDWSQSFGVALYFSIACSKDIQDPCIWILDPYYLNDLEKKKSKFTSLKYCTLYNPARDFKVNYYDQFITGVGKLISAHLIHQRHYTYKIK
ncbi:MAG: FRG domain-containing protein [Bacteroidetes bacterium]|nr:FRG domain-containing protein [Bacteroidota bacterium]